jgi:nitrate reductase molybdenum cofactor assembly chaperone
MPASVADCGLLVVGGLLRYPDLSLQTEALPDFHDEVARVSPEGMQELYTMTFDLNPVATLEAGWHLWGEQYERGRFLADLRAKQDALGIDAGTELPDHLPVLLEMLAREFDPELATQVLAALEKIEKPLSEQGNPYRHVIAAARAAVRGAQEARA